MIRFGESQASVARACGLSPRFVGQVFDGSRDPRLSNVVRLAAAMRIPLDRLARALTRAQDGRRARMKARATIARLTR